MPSFNQSEYLEQAISSVLEQNYPNLEFIIMDGGSTDGSRQIIEKYASSLSYWESRPDLGQSHALAKGFSISDGEIMGWLNSDDFYEKGALQRVAKVFIENSASEWAAFRCYFIDGKGNKSIGWDKPKEEIERCFVWNNLMQMGVFWRRSIWERVKGIDIDLHHSMDYDLWFQFRDVQLFPHWSDEVVANFRIHPGSKTSLGGDHIGQENALIHQRNTHLLRKPLQKAKVWLYRRDFQAHRLVNIQIKKGRTGWVKTIFHAFYLAPWILLQRRFYSKLKQGVGSLCDE
jgi:glycosyltransferase involved in cell wall biosynthesis